MQKLKRGCALLLALALVFSLLTVSAGAAEIADYEPGGSMTELYAAVVTGGGAAPETGVYSIGSAEELGLLAAYVNAGNEGAGLTFCLTGDVDLGGESAPWTPIGRYAAAEGAADHPFKGTFDGCGHAVTGLWVGGDAYARGDGVSNEANGLFGINAGVIQNVAVEGEIHTYRCGAIIAGHNEGTIRACSVSGSVSANGGGGQRGSGGAAGENSGTVEDCASFVTVYNAYRRAGGIVGYNQSAGSVVNSFFAGSASSASAGYSGGVAATNDGTVTNCYWLEGSSADSVGYYREEAGATGTFTAEGLLSGSENTLLSALTGDSFKAGPGALPILFWDKSDVRTYTVTVAQPAAGGSLTATYGEEKTPLEDSASLPAGTVVELTASAAAEGWFFKSFLIGETAAKGTAVGDGFTASWTVTGDAELSALYVSMEDTAITVATQAGENGGLTPVRSYSWNELFALAGEEQEPAGYMYTHGTDGWTVIGATRYVPLAALLTDAGVTPAAADEIIAMAADGHSRVIPTWELLQGELYFYPNASGSGSELSTPTEGKVAVPAALALTYATGKEGDTAADKLSAAAEQAAFTGSIRFVFGSTEEDYVDAKNEGGTLSGNRLWSGVETLAVRTPVDTDAIKLSLFGREHSLTELMPYETEAAFTTVKKGETVEVAVKGITMTDLLTKVCGLTGTEYAAVTFTAGDGFTAEVAQADYGWDDVMLIWEGNGASETKLQSAVNGGAGKLWNKGVVSLTGTEAAFNFNGTYLSLALLKEKAVTNTGWTYSAKGSENVVDVTGVTLAALLAAYAPEAEPASLRFYARNTDGSPDYGPEIALAGTSADQIMVIWEGAGASEASLRSAVNGGTGKQWWSGVVGCELNEAALTVAGIPFTAGMIRSAQDLEGVTWTKGSKEAAVTGTTLEALFAAYPAIPTEDLYAARFTAADGFTSPAYVLSEENTLANAAIVWADDTPGSAVNGGAGRYWVNGLAEVTLQYAMSFRITASPASATVTVTDDAGKTLAPAEDGSYRLVSGESYTYTVSAPGYTPQSDSFTPSAALTALTVTLNAQGGGVQPPQEETLFSVYLQTGEDGTPAMVKAFTASEVKGILQKGTYSYLFYKNGGWAAIVATELLTLDDLFAEAGLTDKWKSGSYLKFVCTDGVYGKSYPDYDDISTAVYTFDENGTPSVVPAGVAISWESGTVGSTGALEELTAENIAAIAATAKDTGSYRLVYGTTQALFESANAGGAAPAGARSPTGVISMILVAEASTVPTGDVGTVHVPEPAEPGETEEPAAPAFVDVAEDAWYKEAVDYAAAAGLMQGVAAGRFAPEQPMTRAMVVTVLHRLAGEPEAAPAAFADVAADAWYAKAVNWAAETGVTLGTGKGFAPEAEVTREQLVTFLHRYAVLKGMDVSVGEDTNILSYDDAFDIAEWAMPAMQWACGAGVIEGRTASTLAPRGTATRAEVAAILMRFVKLQEA